MVKGNELWRNSNIWNYSIEHDIDHPTPKPVKLIENIINHSSNKGDLILDPFLGSGTTAIACINTGRHYIGIEKDEGYFNIANERINKATEQDKLTTWFEQHIEAQ